MWRQHATERVRVLTGLCWCMEDQRRTGLQLQFDFSTWRVLIDIATCAVLIGLYVRLSGACRATDATKCGVDAGGN